MPKKMKSQQDSEWTSDFDDYVGDAGNVGNAGSDYEKLDYDDDDDKADENDTLNVASIFKSRGSRDLTAIQTRQFSLGEDLILADYVGNMGFDEVTDWEYYYENEDDPSDRKVVQPNPFDSSKPKRTRTSSGSVVSVNPSKKKTLSLTRFQLCAQNRWNFVLFLGMLNILSPFSRGVYIIPSNSAPPLRSLDLLTCIFFVRVCVFVYIYFRYVYSVANLSVDWVVH